MRIAFICGGMEPGRDGVGDYTRRLAGECIRQGHEVRVVAYRDSAVGPNGQTLEEVQRDENTSISCLRVSPCSGGLERVNDVTNWLRDFRPDWLSCQFVPYSFQRKGMCFGLGGELRCIASGMQRHVMVHELWVGVPASSWSRFCRRAVTSLLQQAAIRQLFTNLRPQVVHTHLATYQRQLRAFMLQGCSLPLFSNIPIAEHGSEQVEVQRMDFASAAVERADTVIGVMFSRLELCEVTAGFLLEFNDHLRTQGRTLSLVLCGGQNSHQQDAAESWRRFLKGEIECTSKGHLCSEALSKVIRTASFGVTSLPRHALGKSGAVAAFIAHERPVAAPVYSCGRPIDDYGFVENSLREAVFISPRTGAMEKAAFASRVAATAIQLPRVAARFLSDLRA